MYNPYRGITVQKRQVVPHDKYIHEIGLQLGPRLRTRDLE